MGPATHFGAVFRRDSNNFRLKGFGFGGRESGVGGVYEFGRRASWKGSVNKDLCRYLQSLRPRA